MLHNDKDGKQGALFACSNKSLLEREMQNSGEFSFWFLPGIKKTPNLCVTPSLWVQKLFISVCWPQENDQLLGGEHWKNNPRPDISVRQQLPHCLFIHFTHGPSATELSAALILNLAIFSEVIWTNCAYRMYTLKEFHCKFQPENYIHTQVKENKCIVGCPGETTQMSVINYVEQYFQLTV